MVVFSLPIVNVFPFILLPAPVISQPSKMYPSLVIVGMLYVLPLISSIEVSPSYVPPARSIVSLYLAIEYFAYIS